MELEDAAVNAEHQLQNALDRINSERDLNFGREGHYDAFGLWMDIRYSVLTKWDGRCEECKKKVKHPHVHHVFGRCVRCYQVLCPNCHAEIHGNPDIAKFGNDGGPHE
jgi:hypothetical protein